jgi:rhodanese-related sulfurtransferase
MTSGRCAAGLMVLLLLYFPSGCLFQSQETRVPKGEVQSGNPKAVRPREALELIHHNNESSTFVILDVRTPEEFRSGYIEGALNMDYYSPGFQVELSKLERTKTYLIYCRTGSRTEGTLTLMREQQFRQVYVLEGGITAWRAAGLPVAGRELQ